MQMNKEQYVAPVAEFIEFEVEDVIAASQNTGGGFEGEWDFNIPEI